MSPPDKDITLASLEDFLGPVETNILPAISCETKRSPHSPNVLYVTLRATTNIADLSTGQLDKPRVYKSWRPSRARNAADLHFLGFQCSEFGLPIRASDAELKFDFYSRIGYVRPRSVFPLIVMSRSTSECVMLAPLDSFHDQVLSITETEAGDRELHWGWSGDLESVPLGFHTTLAVIQRSSPRELIKTWATLVRDNAKAEGIAVNNRGRYDDVSVAKLSMWTDNGASYWYRTEKGMDLPSTLEATLESLNKIQVPIASVELDSWFYRHEITRKVADVGYPNVVPPTGMLRWEPREDVLGKESIKGLRTRLGNRPLILHSRHISSKSDYLSDPSLPGETWWVDRDRAHPAGPTLFQKWMQQAYDWGATTFEQDWLVEVFLGVRDLRAYPGRIATWQRQLDRCAKERSISLIWCMATPADMAQAALLEQIVAVRSCDDYRYAKDPSILWRWHLTTSCLIRELRLLPFKDVFMSHTNNRNLPDIDGDPNALLEACLSALSAGPVGIGDRLGKTNRDVVRKTCRSDGVLLKPDAPLAALDRSLRDPSGLLWAETSCGAWRYIVVIRTGIQADIKPEHKTVITESFQLHSPALIYNWRTTEASINDSITASLGMHDWVLWVICPLAPTAEAVALIGDSNAFATMGDRRFRFLGLTDKGKTLSFDVLGDYNETVGITYWSATGGVETKPVQIPARGWMHCSLSCNSNNDAVLKSR